MSGSKQVERFLDIDASAANKAASVRQTLRCLSKRAVLYVLWWFALLALLWLTPASASSVCASIILVVGIGIAFAIARAEHTRLLNVARDEFQREAKAMVSRFQWRFTGVEDLNEAIARAFEVQPNFSLTEFELIATAAMHRSSSFAAAMAWAPVIKHAGRTEFEHEINATINDIPTKTARGTFDRYLPIKYTMPLTSKAIGNDLFSDIERLDMTTLAEQLRKPVLSRKMELRNGKTGTMMRYPVFCARKPSKLLGMISWVVPMTRLFDNTIAKDVDLPRVMIKMIDKNEDDTWLSAVVTEDNKFEECSEDMHGSPELVYNGAVTFTNRTFHVSLSALDTSVFEDDIRSHCLGAMLKARQTALHAAAIASSSTSRQVQEAILGYLFHELRNPLHMIMAMSDLILAEHKSTLPPGVQEDLDNISVAARHMEMLVQDVSELESLHGGVTITPRDTDISGLLRDVSNQHKHAFHDDVRFTIQLARRVPRSMMLDPLRVRQMIGNALMFVASKATRGNVVLSVFLAGHSLVIKVQFCAPKRAVFKRDATNSAELLSLTITQRIAEAMDAELSFVDMPSSQKALQITVPILSESTDSLSSQASTQSDGALPRLVTPRGPQIPIEHTPAVLRPGGLPYTSALFRSQSMNDGTFDATATPRRAVSVPNLIASMSSLPSPTAGCSAGASFTANSSDDQSSPSVTSSPPPRVASPRSVAIAASTSIDSQRPCPGHHPIATSRSATTAGAHTSNAHTATIAATALPAPVPGLGEHETLAVDTSPPHVQRDAVPVSIQPETASFAVIPPRRRRRRKKRNANRLEGPCVGYNVLVVDDEAVIRNIASRYLGSLGVKYHCLEDGIEILPHLETNENVECIMLDIVMKRSNGIDVCQALRKQGVTLPIVAVTASVGPEDIRRYKAEGFSGLLKKPFNRSRLSQMLQACQSAATDESFFTIG